MSLGVFFVHKWVDGEKRKGEEKKVRKMCVKVQKKKSRVCVREREQWFVITRSLHSPSLAFLCMCFFYIVFLFSSPVSPPVHFASQIRKRKPPPPPLSLHAPLLPSATCPISHLPSLLPSRLHPILLSLLVKNLILYFIIFFSERHHLPPAVIWPDFSCSADAMCLWL